MASDHLAQAGADARERPISELVKELAGQTSSLVRQEMRLAQAELTEQGKSARRGAGMLAGAGVAAVLCLAAVSAAAIVALDSFLALWLAAVLVGAVWAIVAAALAARGRSELQRATPPAPQTVETVKEDIQWAKTQPGSGQT
jgi:uncharacterized membrane protein YqjE